MKRAALLILEKDNKIVFARRSATMESLPGKWSLPSETMRDGESVEDAAKRCGREELDLEIKNVKKFDQFHFNNGDEEKELNFVKAEYDGEVKIKATEELTDLDIISFKEFFKKYSDDKIGHGLIYLRKKLG